MKAHYDPFFEQDTEYFCEKWYCGTNMQEFEENYTNDKSCVNCKKCIKLFSQADREMEMHSQNFANECWDYLKFINA